MGQGLQVWDSTGKKLLDSSLQTSSIFGVVSVSTVGVTNIDDDRFSWGTPFFLLDTMYAGTQVKANISGNRLTITVSSNTGGLASFKPAKVYYGVF